MATSDTEDLTLSVRPLGLDRASLLNAIQSTQRQVRDGDQVFVSKNFDVTNAFLLHFFSPSRGWLSILVLDNAGKTVLQKDKRGREGDNLINLDVSILSAGNYRIRILIGQQVLAGSFSI